MGMTCLLRVEYLASGVQGALAFGVQGACSVFSVSHLAFRVQRAEPRVAERERWG